MATTVGEIYQVFQDYYGEDRVDLQTNPSTDNIIIHFPMVCISNEFGDSLDMRDLWVKVIISNGKYAGFYINKSTYSYNEYKNNYIHSHVPRLIHSNPQEWKTPCLGSGPIRETIRTLIVNNNLNIWRLFCRELDLYMPVESISGGPYIRMTTVTSDEGICTDNNPILNNTLLTDFNLKFIKNFIPYLCEHHNFKCNYVEQYRFNIEWYTYLITLSNLFIDYCNENKIPLQLLLNKGILHEYVIKNRKFYKKNTINDLNIRNTTILTFKGNDIKLKVDSSNNTTTRGNYLIDSTLATVIQELIYNIINSNYGKENRSNRERYLL